MNFSYRIICALMHLFPALMLPIGFKLQQPALLIVMLLVPWLLYQLITQPQLKDNALEVLHFQLSAMMIYLPLIGLLTLSSHLSGDAQKSLVFLFMCMLSGILLLYFLVVLAAFLASFSKPFRYIGIWRPFLK